VPSRIEKLTASQTARFSEFIEKWIQIGLCTDRADRDRAERSQKALYKLANLQEPKIIWVLDPISAAIAAVLIGAWIRNQNKMNSAVHSAVRLVTIDLFKNKEIKDGGSRYGGSLWASYAAWADFFNEVCTISIDRNYLDSVESCGYWWQLNGIVIASDRPSHIRLDSQGRLHDEKRQSIGYCNGVGWHHIHGVRVPEFVVEKPEQITPQLIQKESNAEVRRVMMDRYGAARYVKDVGGKLIHQDRFGKLYHFKDERFLELVAVEVKNSTPEIDGSIKNYFLFVDPSLRTAKEAVAWTFGMKPDEYDPAIET